MHRGRVFSSCTCPRVMVPLKTKEPGDICTCEVFEVLEYTSVGSKVLPLCLRPPGSSKLKGSWVLLTSTRRLCLIQRREGFIPCCLGLPGRRVITCIFTVVRPEADTCLEEEPSPVYLPLSDLEPILAASVSLEEEPSPVYLPLSILELSCKRHELCNSSCLEMPGREAITCTLNFVQPGDDFRHPGLSQRWAINCILTIVWLEPIPPVLACLEEEPLPVYSLLFNWKRYLSSRPVLKRSHYQCIDHCPGWSRAARVVSYSFPAVLIWLEDEPLPVHSPLFGLEPILVVLACLVEEPLPMYLPLSDLEPIR